MKINKSGLLNYYTEYRDREGKNHYAIHQYRHSDGWVWTMRDHKFEYSTNRKNKKMGETINPNVTIDAKPNYDPNMNTCRPTKYYAIYDKSKRLIAKLRSAAEANEYKIKGMGEFTIVEEENKN